MQIMRPLFHYNNKCLLHRDLHESLVLFVEKYETLNIVLYCLDPRGVYIGVQRGRGLEYKASHTRFKLSLSLSLEYSNTYTYYTSDIPPQS